jgi:TRAP-type C4-dicarboxylate transport system substrate-binding protein
MPIKAMLRTSLLLAALSLPAAAQEVTLKVAHFLPPASTAQKDILGPWCDKLGSDSNGRIKCQFYPAMQLGGAPPQLFDQARDGVADVIWTVPTYQAGRFTKSEVFEIPFMTKTATGSAQALWEYIQANALDEFKGTKLIMVHVQDGAQLHFASKQAKTADDLKGLKIRAPSRIGSLFIAALGATPVQMPVPQVTEALSKGVIDGVSVPWEIVPTIKLDEIATVHLETAPNQLKMSNTIFVVAMNEAKYQSLPDDLKKVIDANSGIEWSKKAGAAFDAKREPNRELAKKRGNTFIELSDAEYKHWAELTAGVAESWKKDAAAKGADGSKLLEVARALVQKYDR